MDIKCYLVTNGEFKNVTISEELLTELCKSLRENETTPVHFSSGSIDVEGVYIPAKDCKNTMFLVEDE